MRNGIICRQQDYKTRWKHLKNWDEYVNLRTQLLQNETVNGTTNLLILSKTQGTTSFRTTNVGQEMLRGIRIRINLKSNRT